jgi:hypothetical protein
VLPARSQESSELSIERVAKESQCAKEMVQPGLRILAGIIAREEIRKQLVAIDSLKIASGSPQRGPDQAPHSDKGAGQAYERF